MLFIGYLTPQRTINRIRRLKMRKDLVIQVSIYDNVGFSFGELIDNLTKALHKEKGLTVSSIKEIKEF